jgi:hypothetical protein
MAMNIDLTSYPEEDVKAFLEKISHAFNQSSLFLLNHLLLGSAFKNIKNLGKY